MMPVADRCIVTLRYKMCDGNGVLLEDRMRGEAPVYLQGGNDILPELQRQLVGLTPGQRRLVTLQRPEPGITAVFLFDVVIEDVRAASPAELLVGYPLTLAPDCGADCACHSEPVSNQRL